MHIAGRKRIRPVPLPLSGRQRSLSGYGGLTLLTDPNFLHRGDHAHLGYGLTSKRLTNPAIELEDLPHVDMVILSQMHGDHFDPLVQQKLDRHIPITTTEESAEILGKMGFNKRYALKTWDSLNLKKAARRYKSPRCRGVTAPRWRRSFCRM